MLREHTPGMALMDLHLVSHTHWDREWYHGVERFRQRLVALIDELLAEHPHSGESFLLDGQAILVEDYLAIRPERAAELASLLRDGRLEAGPWYVLADELIPTGEALIRNLLLGRDTLRRLRAEPPPVLYCPDSFGHPAVLPDIAAGFGIDVVILWRGFGGARWPQSDVVRWRGPGGNTVLLYHLPPDGYEFGSSLPDDPAAAAERWARIAQALRPRANTGVAILLNGADHHARQRNYSEAVRALANVAAPVVVHASSLRAAARAIVVAARDQQLAVIDGELRDSYGYAWTLQGTHGTRAAQKRRNARAERRLVRDVEPWMMLARAGPSASARALLQHTWRTLLQAHPHDTLCGTSIDLVAAAFDARLASVEQESRSLREDALLGLVGHDRDAARMTSAAWEPVVLLRNRAPRARGGVVELTLRTTLADVAVGPGSAHRQGARRRPAPWGVAGVPLQILSKRERIELTESPRAYPDADVVLEARAVGWTDPVGGFIVETRRQRGRANGAIPHPVVAQQRALDNGRVRVEVSETGDVTLHDHALGRRVDRLLAFERCRDVGDLYTPAMRDALPAPEARQVRVVHRGPLRGELAIEYRVARTKGGAGGRIHVALQLDADARFLRVLVRGENAERDQRLRVCFSTGLADARTSADAAFLPVERRLTAIAPADAEMEHVVPTAPLHRWVARFTNQAGATLVSDGLAEYEARDDGSIAATLVRSVGELSRADLPERPGHAGWPAPTPDAQCTGPYRAGFAIAMHGPDSPAVRDEIERLADDVLVPLIGETLRSNMREPLFAGGLELHGAGLAFSAAMPAQRDGWSVLRCVNHRAETVSGAWHIRRPVAEAWRARLDETPLHALTIADGTIAFEAAPGEIVTIIVK